MKRLIPFFVFLFCIFFLCDSADSSEKDSLSLTETELSWLEDHPIIRVGADSSWMPIEFLSEDGNYRGLSIDYLTRIEPMLGIRFEYVRTNWQELITLAEQKQVDLFPCVARTAERKKYLIFTEPYIEMPVGIFTKESAAYISDLTRLEGKKISVVEDYAIHEYLVANYPNIDLVLVKTPEEGIRKINERKAFGFIGNIITTGHLLSHKGYMHIKLAGEVPFAYAQRMGIRKDWPQLREILQKAISTIPAAERNAIYNQWVPVVYEKPINYNIFGTIGAGILLAILVVLFWYRKLKSEVNRKTEVIKLNEERLSALWDISRKEDMTGEELALYALEQAVRLTGSTGGYFHFYDEQTEMLSLNLWTEYAKEKCATTERGHYPLEKAGIWADAIRQRRPIIHNDYQAMAQKQGTPEGHFPLLRHMSVPILFENRIIAIAGVANKATPYDDKDARQLSLLMKDAWQIIKRRESEGAKEKIDAQFRSFMDNFPAYIYTKNKNLEHVFCNRLTLELSKRRLEDFIGTTSYDLLPPETARKLEKSDQLVLNGKRLIDIEYQVKNSADDMVWFRDIKFPIEMPDGERFLGGIAVDITAQKETIKKLEESEGNYREIFNSASDAISIVNIKSGKFVDCNRKALEIFKCTSEEYLGRTPADFSPPMQADGRSSQERVQEVISMALTQHFPTFEWLHMRSDGEVFDAEVSVSLIEIESEQCIQAIVRDITERKRLENEIRHERDFNKTLINASPTFLVTMDADGKTLMMNKAMLNTLGYHEDEVLGADYLTTFVPEEDREMLQKTFSSIIEKGKATVNENWVIAKDGSRRLVEWHGRAILDNDGNLDFFFGVGNDITERTQARKEKEKLEAQLHQAQKMEAIGTLAGGIAHDFNNILSAIFAYTQLARSKADNPDRLHSFLDEIFNGALRASDLVKQILTFSRREPVELKPLKMQLVVKEALKLLRSSIPTTVEMKQDIRQDCEAVLADPTQIHQIVMNLCTNAYHAMRESGGTLSVALGPVELHSETFYGKTNLEPGPYLKLEIGDTGCGISRMDQERIFDPYYTTKEKGEGTGLGLAVVHGIVHGIGGDIAVESELGKGSTFKIYLPVAGDKKEFAQEKGVTPNPTGNERILFVDDDEAIVRAYKEMLESLGYTVTASTSSTVAMGIFEKAPNDFDLVITDMTMPKMTGVDLTRKIQDIRADMPIILCTGFSELIDAEKAKELGIHEYIMKPIIKNELAKTVRKVLDADTG